MREATYARHMSRHAHGRDLPRGKGYRRAEEENNFLSLSRTRSTPTALPIYSYM